MNVALGFILGTVFGVAVALLIVWLHGRSAKAAAEQRLRDAFAALSAEALSANNEQFLALARENLSAHTSAGAAELEGRKKLIDQSLQQVTERVQTLGNLVSQLESSRKQDYGQLGQRLAESAQQVSQLRQTAESLRAALAHPQRRGQWGERMADDILQMAGMIEGVNYTKQETMADSRRRPDFTFLLGGGVTLNMDVKFPLDNYLKHLEADGDDARQRAADAFVSDVKSTIRAVATREYINPAGGTADFALIFIPNEQLFGFIQEVDPAVLREAAERRVLLVGPLSLLAVLAIARQAAESANLTRQVDEALILMGEFAKQWDKYKTEMDRLGDRLDSAVKQYQTLTNTRTNTLEKPLVKLEQLRQNHAIESADRAE